jgi:hypothetical protein
MCTGWILLGSAPNRWVWSSIHPIPCDEETDRVLHIVLWSLVAYPCFIAFSYMMIGAIYDQ